MTQTRPQWWEWTILALLLVAFAAMTLAASPRKSASFDEQFHLTAGYAYWKTGDYRLATTHPPLAGLIALVPLLGDPDIHLPLEHWAWQQSNRWDFSDAVFWYGDNDARSIFERARLGIIVLGLGLVAAAWAWGRALFGAVGGVVAGLLVAFDPNLIANARQVTTDMPLTLFMFLSMWQVWRWLNKPAWTTLLLAGVCAGLTVFAKYNGVLVAPLVLLALALYPLPSGANRGREWGMRLLALLTIGVVALAVLWAGYKFDFGTANILGVRLPMVAPYYWNNLTTTVGDLVAQGEIKPDFLLGEVGTEGWWYYFPVAIGVKTPLPLLILFVLGALTVLFKGGWRRQAPVWLPLLFFLGMALTGILTIGYRHILPLLPFAALLAANNVRWLEARQQNAQRVLALAGGALLIWLVVATVRFFPNHDSYFNEAAGPWQNWSQLLVDSNLDWGQDLPALADVMREMGIERVNLAYFGRSAPEVYGVNYSPLPGFQRFLGGREPAAWNPVSPEPGWYAVSATALRLGTLTLSTVDLFGYFRNLEPVARAGYSIYLYNVPETPLEARAIFTGAPVWQRNANMLGSPKGRLLAAWRGDVGSRILAAEGAAAAIPTDEQTHEVGAALGVHTDGGVQVQNTVFTLEAAQFEGEIAPGESLPVWLYWQRGDGLMPMPAPARAEPVSAFVHLVPGVLDPAATELPGQVANFDGWEVALRGLATGDLVIQRAMLDLPDDLPPGAYTLLAGIYSPQDGQRLAVTQPDMPAAFTFASAVLGTLQISE